jgi:hypothetical protein
MGDVLKLTALAGPFTRRQLPGQMGGNTVAADVDRDFFEAWLYFLAFAGFITKHTKGCDEGRQ